MATMNSLLALTNTTRVLDDIRAIHVFGNMRPSLSTADMAARRWLVTRMEAAGLEGVQLDGLGTVYGSAGVDNVPALLLGAHTDTPPQPHSWLDSSLGIAYALEAARVLQQGGAADWTAWSVIDWQDAGSRFGTLTASSAFVSSATHALRRTPALRSAQREAKVPWVPVMHASGRHGGWLGYLEAHTERVAASSTRRLAASNASLGIVGAIVGVRRFRVACSGVTSHTSSVTMMERRDATLEAMRLAVAADDGLRALCAAWEDGGCDARWTIDELGGFVAPSTVAGAANVSLEVRAVDNSLLGSMARLVTSIVDQSAQSATARGAPVCAVHSDDIVAATPMDKGMVECVTRAAAETVGEHRAVAVPSMSLHDASPLSTVMPAALLLLPNTPEDAGWEARVTDGARAYVRAALMLAMGQCESAGGPTCIVGDVRRNQRLNDEGWAEALDYGNADEEEAAPAAEGAASNIDSDALEDFPDL